VDIARHLFHNAASYLYIHRQEQHFHVMASTSHYLGKLLVIKEERDDDNGQLNEYKWVNEPGLPVLVQPQSQQPILHVDTSLLKYLTEVLQREPCIGW
jgi:hypothetical protein